jgi:riboflavin biosynthesis pyrimidine reductase
VLVEATGLPAFELPGELEDVYGGTLGFEQPRLYANFVASLDGVTAIAAMSQSSHLLAAGSEHDRFLMGLLRACADVVLIGAGTLHGSPRTHWTPEHAYPPAAELYAELRRWQERPPQPTLAVLSGSGRIDPTHPGLRERTLVLTSQQGAARLGDRLPPAAAIVPLAAKPPLDPRVAVEALQVGGHKLILCEGGPSLFGELVRANLVDELFLTLSPVLVGRPPDEPRLSLLENAALPERLLGTLLSIRRGGSHLFLRYQLPQLRREAIPARGCGVPSPRPSSSAPGGDPPLRAG